MAVSSWARAKMFYALHQGKMSIRTFMILYYGYSPKLVDEAFKEMEAKNELLDAR